MEKTIVDVIKERRLKFFGHINRRPLDSVIYQAYSGNFTGKRPPGRPHARWTDMIKADTGLPLATAERKTMDGVTEIEREQGAFMPELISQVSRYFGWLIMGVIFKKKRVVGICSFESFEVLLQGSK